MLRLINCQSLQDENDNAPNFDHDVYKFNLKKSEEEGLFVGKVHALDRDSPGPNSEIVFSLAHPTDFFDVDGSSGIIRISKPLPQVAKENVFALVVVASDLGSPPRSSRCRVEVTLAGAGPGRPDSGDAPRFAWTRSPAALPRSVRPGATITTFKPVEEGYYKKRLKFALVGGNATELFDLEPRTGALKVKRPLPSWHHVGTILSLNVSMTIEANEGRSSYHVQHFVVTKENLHAPVFQAPSTRVYIREDEPVGNTIIAMAATDDDNEGLNGEVDYAIVEGDSEGKFLIDEKSGKITVGKALDYEEVKQYNLVVSAADRGFEPRSSSTEVKVILQDVNDNAPTFVESSLRGHVRENSPPGSLVAQLLAEDPDSPKFSAVEFAFLDGEKAQSDFEVDSKTGMVVALRSFDYEAETAFALEVEARNPGSAQLATRATLNISVVGENEFPPRFIQPVFQFAISESSGPGAAVGRVEAEDGDSGREGEVFYYLVGSSNGAGFVVDRATGVLSVGGGGRRGEGGGLDREAQNRHVLRVMAKNRGPLRGGGDADEAQVIVQVRGPTTWKKVAKKLPYGMNEN